MAQKLRFSVGMNVGASRLQHNTRFESTTLRNLYETIELTHKDGYEWEEFERDFQLRESFNQIRFGFFGMITHRDWPIIVMGEAMSSPSSYEKMAYGATVGLGKELFTFRKEFSCYFLGGYKFVWDNGFGSNTLVNSIGHRDGRELVATYFDPHRPLGTTMGQLFTLRLGAGKTLDRDKRWTAGIDAYGELDLTPRIKRESRMNTIGINVFARFSINRTQEDSKYVPDYYYRASGRSKSYY